MLVWMLRAEERIFGWIEQILLELGLCSSLSCCGSLTGIVVTPRGWWKGLGCVRMQGEGGCSRSGFLVAAGKLGFWVLGRRILDAGGVWECGGAAKDAEGKEV